MFLRLWWKEARQTWLIWGFLVLVGMAVQSYVFRYWGTEVAPGAYARVALVVTMMYLFLIAAAVFAGERENGTLWILDTIPVERLRVWSAKASFALGTTLALGIVLWLSALAFGGDSPEWRTTGLSTLVWGLTALGWGLLWSAVLSNALRSAVLAMASVCLTLLLLMSLQNGSTIALIPLGAQTTAELAHGGREVMPVPVLIALAALTTGASAWAFRFGGPPRKERRWARPAALAVVAPVPAPDEAATNRRPGRVWTATVPRLFWETLRQIRAELWMLVGLAVAGAVAPYLISVNTRDPNAMLMLTIVGAVILSLVTGVLAFNGENRGRTHRFLLHHGARPSVVWAVKVATWWAASLGLWAIAFLPVWLPVWLTLPPRTLYLPILGVTDIGSLISWTVWGLTIPFAIAVVCGMIFRRGIMAVMIAVVATLAVVIPMFGALAAQVLFPLYWPYIASGILGVSWAWSAGWLHDAPGWRRWARLAFYTAAVPAILLPLYIAGRAWGVQELPPKQIEAFFQRSRVVAPVADQDNAAPLYWEAYRLISRNAYPSPAPDGGKTGMTAGFTAPNAVARFDKPPAWATDLQLLDQESFDPPPDWVTEWLAQLEPALAKLREGAKKPACRYMDLRTASELDRPNEPPIHSLLLPPAVSARVRLARGDLDGAWAEIETLTRLARQYSYTSRWSTPTADAVADSLVLRWAADPRQTVATIEKAARAWKNLPPSASPAERIRIDAVLFQNMLDLPREELIGKLLDERAGPKRKVSAANALLIDVQTTPWEIVRARRIFNLLTAAQIQRFERNPFPFIPARNGLPIEQWGQFNWMWIDPDWGFLVLEDGRAMSFSPKELNALSYTTPLLRYTSMGSYSTLQGRSQTIQRAIWLTLLLRLHQTRHDGQLPRSLDEILAPPSGDGDLAAKQEDLVDPYSGMPFGYVASHGQMLLPIGMREALSPAYANRRLKSTEGCRLLYSVGPDGVDNRAERNVGADQKGDLVFPLKDNVKPPTTGPH